MSWLQRLKKALRKKAIRALNAVPAEKADVWKEQVALWADAYGDAGGKIAQYVYGWDNSPRKGPMAEREYFVVVMKDLKRLREEMTLRGNRIFAKGLGE